MREQRRQEKLNRNADNTSSTNVATEEEQEQGATLPMLSPLDVKLTAEGGAASSSVNTQSDHSSSGWSTADSQVRMSDGMSNSMFSTSSRLVDAVEVDRRRVEGVLETFKGPCLLDCLDLSLESVDVFSARRVPDFGDKFRIVRQKGKVLKEKGAAKLYIERNLYEDFCRNGESDIYTCKYGPSFSAKLSN